MNTPDKHTTVPQEPAERPAQSPQPEVQQPNDPLTPNIPQEDPDNAPREFPPMEPQENPVRTFE